MMRRALTAGLLLGLTALAVMPAAAQPAFDPSSVRTRPPEDEIVYFLLPDRFANGDPSNDRGGLSGDRLATGFDPTAKGFFQGGDIAGLIQRLDYVQALGATAIWLGPIYRNKPVQGAPGEESAGYHGYWITDFTRVDPHFGTNDELKRLVDAVHARGMKIYLDIIVNHTADVIQYAECQKCEYRPRASFPYQRRGGVDGRPINAGFLGDGVSTADNFARLTDPTYAYTPVVPAAERTVKVPAWLNDPIHYHNRGDTIFRLESSTMGDFAGLDDLFTESPVVRQGMVDIFGDWIDRFGIDGYRVDTARHVEPGFWQVFIPAIRGRAAAQGIPNFHVFAEAAYGDLEPGLTARHTRVDGFPAVLDFAFHHGVVQSVAEARGTDRMAKVFEGDALYQGGEPASLAHQTFVSNHDAGRFAWFVRRARPQADDAEVLARTTLAHAMLLTLRGSPTVYSGDEQGFAGDGNDQDARETLFASRVAVYNDNVLVGTSATTATDNYDQRHPLFRSIADLSALRRAHPALARGRQVTRAYGDGPGLFAVSRFDPQTGVEYLIAFNTSDAPIAADAEVEVASTRFTGLAGACPRAAQAPGSVRLTIPAFGWVVCRAEVAR